MTRKHNVLALSTGPIILLATVAIFFLASMPPSEGQWLGFGLLLFMEVTLYGSLFGIGRTRLPRPHKAGMYAVLTLYALIAALIAVFLGFIWPVGVSAFIILSIALVVITAVLLLLIGSAGMRHTGSRGGKFEA